MPMGKAKKSYSDAKAKKASVASGRGKQVSTRNKAYYAGAKTAKKK